MIAIKPGKKSQRVRFRVFQQNRRLQTFSLADLFDRSGPLVNQHHTGVALKDIASWPPGISLRSDQTSGPSRIRSSRRHARFTNQRREVLRFVPDLLRLFLEELLFLVRETLRQVISFK